MIFDHQTTDAKSVIDKLHINAHQVIQIFVMNIFMYICVSFFSSFRQCDFFFFIQNALFEYSDNQPATIRQHHLFQRFVMNTNALYDDMTLRIGKVVEFSQSKVKNQLKQNH